jgi:hypothetical protein
LAEIARSRRLTLRLLNVREIAALWEVQVNAACDL